MAYIYLNMNPIKRNTNDCVIRALSYIIGIPWEDVYMELAYEGLSLYDMMEANSTWGNFLKRNGYVQSVLPDTCPLCYTVRDFCRDHPYGKYILATGSHVIACESGDWFDTTDSGNEIITYYFRKKEDE